MVYLAKRSRSQGQRGAIRSALLLREVSQREPADIGEESAPPRNTQLFARISLSRGIAATSPFQVSQTNKTKRGLYV